MKKLAILGPGVVGGSCAEILLRDADLLERNAGEQLELSYVLARRALPDRPYKTKSSRISPSSNTTQTCFSS